MDESRAQTPNNDSLELKQSRSLRRRLLLLLAATLIVALSGVGVAIFNFISKSEAALWAERQKEAAGQAADIVTGFMKQTQNALILVSLLDVDELRRDPQVLEDFLLQSPELLEIVRLDDTGTVIASANRAAPVLANIFTLSQSVWFIEGKAGNFYQGDVQISSISEPYLILSAPTPDNGVVAARLDMNVLWEVVDNLTFGDTGQSYIVNRDGDVIGHTNEQVAINNTNLEDRPEINAVLTAPDFEWQGSYQNFENKSVTGSTAPIEGTNWIIITEVAAAEVSEVSRVALLLLGVGLAIFGGVLLLIVNLFTRALIFRPLERLRVGATRIGQGDLLYRIGLKRADEVGILSQAFDRMADELEDLYGTLESRVEARTHRLEILAKLSERLSPILKLEELASEIVNQVQENFNYYHVHIYLLDDEGENLVVMQGTGEAGQILKRQGHSISLKENSLVAKAAREGQVVNVPNVRQVENWLPNTLLPETFSELAVPIFLDNAVVGVLDVQEDRIGGFDEGDESLLRSLANHIAIALRNARLFEEIEQALHEAHLAQARFTERSWKMARVDARTGQHLYTKPGLEPVDDKKRQLLEESSRLALAADGKQMITLDEANFENKQALVAPIKVRGIAVGTVQVVAPNDSEAPWRNSDLAVFEAILDQLAQSAENLRLFDETQQKATREQIAREITDKVRASRSIETALKTAAEELSRALGVSRAVVDLQLSPEVEADAPPAATGNL